MKNIPILLVYPPATLSPRPHISEEFNFCLGSAYIIAFLKENGFAAEQFLAFEPINLRECVRRILSINPKVVGFTVYSTNYCVCQLIASKLKEIAPHIIILFGGPTATVQADVILRNNDCVDICVRNEGEETCLELLSLLDNENFDLKKAAVSFNKIKGISYRLENRILATPGRDLFLEHRSVPDYLDKYPSPYLRGVVHWPKLGILTARGCNRNCVYCNCALLSKRMIACHSVDRVVEELDYISKINTQNHIVDIFDDAFTLLPERAHAICDKIIENKIKLPLTCITRCDFITEVLLDKIKEAGFKSVGFSLESAVPRILRVLGKIQPPHTKSDPYFEKEQEFVEKFKKYVIYAKKIGIEGVFASIMIGLPSETLEEGRKTIDLIGSLSDYLDFYAHNLFQVYPGTPLFSYYQKYGLELRMFDNQVHYKTIYPYDSSQIPLAPKSNLESDGRRQGYANMRYLSLSSSKKVKGDYFNRVIVCSDVISEELILWLQRYLALNGQLIQIHSDFNSARQYYLENERAMIRYISPTNYHAIYYQSYPEGMSSPTYDCHGKESKVLKLNNTGDNGIVLMPLRTYLLGNQSGFGIELISTQLVFSSSHRQINPLQSICVDRPTEKEDVLQLYNFLLDLCNRKATFADLFDIPILPYFSSLCRWEQGEPNCRLLETVIVDADNDVKPCWNGEPIGKVGMSLERISKNLRRLYREAENLRGCQNCHKKSVCAMCIFPGPLSGKEYCDLKKNANTEESAQLLRSLELFKEEFT
jgi:radical SAM superfamily enzyme YgiQ (UPF0313 family)